MVNLVYTELLKLKRSKMFLLSIIGAAVAPLMVAIAMFIQEPTVLAKFDVLFLNTSKYAVLIIGAPLYGVITAYLYSREYTEDTLKNLLTIPVSRISLLMSKWILLFFWIMLLTLVVWGLALLMGILLQFEGLSFLMVTQSFGKFAIAGVFLFILSTPIVLITLMLKNFVPTIVVTIVITLLNVMLATSEHRGLFPWVAALDIANGTLEPTYPSEVSYLLIAATAFLGFIASIVYFKKVDVH
ncbi:bacitracin transport system permease protein [Marininema mesophilum]|uniref:Bacitracin transport system permease protein n=1 Tax=Marininema mesophilum TaxID=1048340 RepID=A0A1H3BHW2_9BACL|nr:ABC transporter permease [Marininema mesophilum]SDX41516.1 bacitracin transport system permease protein [Marininema mesophilum]